MIIEESEFIYLLNDYHGTIRNFPYYFKEAYYRLEKDRIVTVSAYLLLKNFTGISIPKLERFLKIGEKEAPAKSVAEVKQELVASGAYIIKGL